MSSEPNFSIFNTIYIGKAGPGMHIFGLFMGGNLTKVNLKWPIIVKQLTIYTFLAFFSHKNMKNSRFAYFLTDFFQFSRYFDFFSVPGCANGKMYLLLQFLSDWAHFCFKWKILDRSNFTMDYIFNLGPSFPKNWFKVKILAFFRFFQKSATFGL